jgi:hypothetical protein
VARRTKRVTITADGRDRGKVFELREKPADDAERWATRAVIALANAGARLPDGALEAGGMAGLELSLRNVVLTGIQAIQGLRFADIEPLLDEMKPCISWCPPGNAPLQPIFPGEDSQVEEVATWYTLRYELLQLHLGFSLAAGHSTTGTTPSQPPAS